MIIIGCDFHSSFQQIAILDTESVECEERKRMHGTGEAEQFYRRLGTPSLVGMNRWAIASGLCNCWNRWATR
jgi:hypothetical protein